MHARAQPSQAQPGRTRACGTLDALHLVDAPHTTTSATCRRETRICAGDVLANSQAGAAQAYPARRKCVKYNTALRCLKDTGLLCILPLRMQRCSPLSCHTDQMRTCMRLGSTSWQLRNVCASSALVDFVLLVIPCSRTTCASERTRTYSTQAVNLQLKILSASELLSHKDSFMSVAPMPAQKLDSCDAEYPQ